MILTERSVEIEREEESYPYIPIYRANGQQSRSQNYVRCSLVAGGRSLSLSLSLGQNTFELPQQMNAIYNRHLAMRIPLLICASRSYGVHDRPTQPAARCQ